MQDRWNPEPGRVQIVAWVYRNMLFKWNLVGIVVRDGKEVNLLSCFDHVLISSFALTLDVTLHVLSRSEHGLLFRLFGPSGHETHRTCH